MLPHATEQQRQAHAKAAIHQTLGERKGRPTHSRKLVQQQNRGTISLDADPASAPCHAHAVGLDARDVAPLGVRVVAAVLHGVGPGYTRQEGRPCITTARRVIALIVQSLTFRGF